MIFLRRFFDFLLFGNIFVAIGAVSLIQSTIIQLRIIHFNYTYSLLVFFATLFIYNLQRIFYKNVEDRSLNSIRRKWIFTHQTTIKTLTLIGFIGVGITFFFNDYKIIFYLSPLLLLSLAYFIPWIKLRKSAGFKLFTLATVWVVTTAMVPLLLAHAPVDFKFILHLSTRFCFMLAICIPFDIRDVAIDAAENVNTLPLQLGEKQTRNLALIFTLVYVFLLVIEYLKQIITFSHLFALLVAAAATFLLVLFSSSKRSEYYYVAGIDGTMILQGLLLVFVATAN